MRIACVHIPQFALQTLTRIDPSLRGAAVAVVGSGDSLAPRAALNSPIVQACSRAAWALGVRIGMTATAANGLAPGQLRVVTAEPALERETVRAIADALLDASSMVDAGGRIGPAGAHLAMYCEVPGKTRGAAFGDRLVELLGTLGLTARIGIADDRFTAWVAASHGSPAKRAEDRPAANHGDDAGVVSVPRGGSSAFLSPRPLSLLAITPEVQHMLEALGVRTLGEFAALPAPSVARPIEADYQALARGESGHALRPYAPEAPIREDIVLSPGGVTTSGAVAQLAERVAIRLAGRARGAARLEVTVGGASGERVVPIVPGVTSREDRPAPLSSLGAGARRVIDSSDELADAIGLALDPSHAAPWRLRVTITGEAIAGDASSDGVAAPAFAAGSAAIAAPGMTAEAPMFDAEAPAQTTLDVLGVVLATTGSGDSGTWRLTHPGHPGHSRVLRDERRDAHRRTRRGRDAAERRRERDREFLQARLFGDRK